MHIYNLNILNYVQDDKLFMGEQTTIVRVFASSTTEKASVEKALTLFKLLSTTYLALPEVKMTCPSSLF